MYIRHGRLSALCTLSLLGAAIAFAAAWGLSIVHIETKLPSIPKLYNSEKAHMPTYIQSKALGLKAASVIDRDALSQLPLFASHILSRPDGLKDPKAVYLKMNSEEHFAPLNVPVYLKLSREGRWSFAKEGEKTDIWIVPSMQGGLSFTANVVANRQMESLGTFKLPVHDGGSWPKEGLIYQGIQLDNELFQRLGVRWCGQNLLASEQAEQVFFKDYVLCVDTNDWLMIKEGRFAVVSSRDHTETSPLLRLKRREKDHLLFELIDSDGLLHLILMLQKSEDILDETMFLSLGQPSLRRLEAVQFSGASARESLREHEVLLFTDGAWKKADLKTCGFGPLLVVEKIDLKKECPRVFVTIYSAMRSKKKELEYRLEPPRRLKL